MMTAIGLLRIAPRGEVDMVYWSRKTLVVIQLVRLVIE